MTRAIHWCRSDLRLRDNTALSEAASRADEVVPLFVLDERLLDPASAGAPRVRFMLDCVARLAATLAERGQQLVVRRGDPQQVLPRIAEELSADLVTWNRDTTPYARRRDAAIRGRIERGGARVVECVDRVVFESGDVLSKQGRPFAVYTPFRNAWRKRFEELAPRPQRAPRLRPPAKPITSDTLPTPEALGFADDGTTLPTGGEEAAQRRLAAFLSGPAARYDQDRNLPALDGTSRLSPYLRFGVISVRECLARAFEAAAAERSSAKGLQVWIDELVWREFYSAILEAHPRVLRSSYRPEYDAIKWEPDEAGFEAWCQGRTGFPIVDAGMRQLAASGWMHNRVRMIVASFLTKDLLVDWRRGERFFYQRLVDGDPASNNGGWQWAAGTGTDAAPYFRIFNPTSQGKRFDPEGDYVRRWVPELAHVPTDAIHEPYAAGALVRDYPPPIVDHAERRLLALERYKTGLGKR